MNKKEKVRNKKYLSVKDKLEWIQKNSLEPELFEDLKQLFKNKGFTNVSITHGASEYGKDLVFSKFSEEFEEERWYAAVVKNKKASQNDFVKDGEIITQINQAFAVPFKNAKGEEKTISQVFVIINGSVSNQATEMLTRFVDKASFPNIKIWDYQQLEAQIDKNSKESFLNNIEPAINQYVKNQIIALSDISISNSVYDLNIDDINDIFINVQTTYSKEIRAINNYVRFDKDEHDKFKEEDIEGSNEILNSDSSFIIHGIPTSGKTLFLKRIGLKALNQTNSNRKLNCVFFFDLQYFDDDKIDIAKLITEQYHTLSGGEEYKEDDFSKIILLFDSIDFIKKDECKKLIFETIDKFVEDNSAKPYQIIVATRDLGFIQNNNFLNEYKSTELLPFNFQQALQLVRKIIPNDESKSQNFIRALKNNLLDTSLQRTPLALTLMAILYRDDKVDLKELPANIFELYNRFTDVYLDRWDTRNGVTSLYKYEQTKHIIAFIAFELHVNGMNTIHENDLKIFLAELSTKYRFDEIETPENVSRFVEHLKSKNGVFYFDKHNNTFHFFNHHFQEYFASLCIEDEADEVLIENFFNTWWSNAIVFYCGKNNKSNKIHKAIIEQIVPLQSADKAYYLTQHSKCLQASHSISIENRNKIVMKLLFEFDNYFKTLLIEADDDPNFFINQVPYVNILNQSKAIFDNVFNSKHIVTKDTLQIFENLLFSENQYSDITNYNLAYYLAFQNDVPTPLEMFESKIEKDVVWNRILYVDIAFLKFKKKFDDKKYLRLKRKMNKNKFFIQQLLSSSLPTHIQLTEKKEKPD